MMDGAKTPWPLKGELRFELPSGRASIVFAEAEHVLVVETIFVPAAARRTGIGALLLGRVMMLADHLGKDVCLSARPLGVSGPDVLPRLIAWYETFGFEVVDRESGKAQMRRARRTPRGAP